MYLPKLSNCSGIFISQVISGDKQYHIVNQVVVMEVPAYAEFTVAKAYEMFANDAVVMAHLPDPDTQSRPVNREFVWNVICSLRSELMI